MAIDTLIPVLRVTNPFNPREFVREEFVWSADKTLLDYFPAPTLEAVVSINGKIVPREQYGVTYLDKTDNLVVCPVPTGGDDGGKSILRIVAMIAVTYFTMGAGNGWLIGANSLTGATAGTFAASAIGVGASMAGSMLINSIFASPQPTKSNASDKSSSYGIDGAKNTSLESIPVPVCYGTFRMAGNILGLHVENTADDTQILYILMSAGEGEVASLSDVEINDSPISDFKDVEVQTRLGARNQEVIPWFSDTVVAINKSQKLTTDWFYSTTTTAVDKLTLDFVAPQGLAVIDMDSGATKEHHVDLEIQYRESGSGAAFLPIPTQTEVGSWVEVTQMTRPGPAVIGTDFENQPIYETQTYWVNNETGLEVTDPEILTYLATAPTTEVRDESFEGGSSRGSFGGFNGSLGGNSW